LVADGARCATKDLEAAVIATPVDKGSKDLVGGAVLPQVLPEMRIDIETKEIGVRIADAQKNTNVTPRGILADPLVASYQQVQSMSNNLLMMFGEGADMFKPAQQVPVHPLPQGSEYLVDEDGVLFLQYPNPGDGFLQTVQVLADGVDKTPVLRQVSDKGSPMFASAMHLSECGYMTVFFGDPNHERNNVAKNTDNHSQLGEVRRKCGFLCKYIGGPFKSVDGGGRNLRLTSETMRSALQDVW